MVNIYKILVLIFIVLLGTFFQRRGYANAADPSVTLSIKEVAQQVLNNSYRSKEINYSSELTRYNYIKQMSSLDWSLSFDSGYEQSKYDSLSGVNFSTQDKTLRNTFNLSKLFSTGTQMSFDLTQASIDYELVPTSISQLSSNNQWIYSVGLTQSLWRNIFGKSTRNDIEATKKTYLASQAQRLEDLENLVLEAIKKYWAVYTSKVSYLEAIQTRNRYRILLNNVKKKQSMGFANPGELAQVQAELEGREQGVYKSELLYREGKDSFITFLSIQTAADHLNLDPKTKVILPPPPMSDIDIKKIRPYEIAEYKKDSAHTAFEAAQGRVGPEIAFIGKMGFAGIDKQASLAQEEAFSMVKPKTYMGIKVQWEFGSNWREEEKLNKQLIYDQEIVKLTRTEKELKDLLENLNRKVKSNYEIALSLEKQKDYRQKAVTELNRSYQLGRIEIRTLIDAINAAYSTEIEYLKSLGDYQTVLSEYLSLKDELVVNLKLDENTPSSKGL